LLETVTFSLHYEIMKTLLNFEGETSFLRDGETAICSTKI
jgi:hypothetical protein